MLGKRVKIEVEVNTDAIPGWGYNPQDFVALIDQYLQQVIPHYDPVVKLGNPPPDWEAIRKDTERT